jgi:hypothetical protein
VWTASGGENGPLGGWAARREACGFLGEKKPLRREPCSEFAPLRERELEHGVGQRGRRDRPWSDSQRRRPRMRHRSACDPYAVRMSTFTSGSQSRIRSVASIPLITGIRMSIRLYARIGLEERRYSLGEERIVVNDENVDSHAREEAPRGRNLPRFPRSSEPSRRRARARRRRPSRRWGPYRRRRP